ncbi:Cytochrome P450 2D27 [Portunus trituberculatus]|uniref:Cytochrome P450 2D27 n=1 Tax=Portunus trituberculatus TaxID=210409 RepID=A0A5B7DPX8_PORTR|nr:Cytochrome P450 2D27 [Portunus trituberculatus]
MQGWWGHGSSPSCWLCSSRFSSSAYREGGPRTFLLKGIRYVKTLLIGIMILPGVGSLLSMPFGANMEMMRGLRKKYGDIASFAIFGTSSDRRYSDRVVVVSGVSTMKEVFAQKSTTDRPQMVFTTVRNRIITDGRTSHIGLGTQAVLSRFARQPPPPNIHLWEGVQRNDLPRVPNTLGTPLNPRGVIGTSGRLWQEQRRFVLHHLRDLGFGKSSYEPIMVEEIAELIDHLVKNEGHPVEMTRLFNRSVINILWAMVMGRRYPYGHVKLNKLKNTFIQPADFNLISPVHHIPHILKIFEFIPPLRHLLSGIKDISSFLKSEIKEFLANEELRSGENLTAFYLKEIEKKENNNFNMDQLAGLIFDMFVAGMETTSSTLTTAIYLMTQHPHVQCQVQQELDKVVGRERLPSFLDMERLPYVQATIHEVQRVFNLLKFSLPHEANQDCKLGGYDIPKGTTLLIAQDIVDNTWGTWLLINLDDAHTNTEYWKNAQEFNPQNFLDENLKYKKNSALMPFGVGYK